MCWLTVDTRSNGPDVETLANDIDLLTHKRIQRVLGNRIEVNCKKCVLLGIKTFLERMYPDRVSIII